MKTGIPVKKLWRQYLRNSKAGKTKNGVRLGNDKGTAEKEIRFNYITNENTDTHL